MKTSKSLAMKIIGNGLPIAIAPCTVDLSDKPEMEIIKDENRRSNIKKRKEEIMVILIGLGKDNGVMTQYTDIENIQVSKNKITITKNDGLSKEVILEKGSTYTIMGVKYEE